MSEDTNKVSLLPASTSFTVEQALQSALLSAPELEDVEIVGTYRDGRLFVRSSKMSRKDANWLLDIAKLYTLGVTK